MMAQTSAFLSVSSRKTSFLFVLLSTLAMTGCPKTGKDLPTLSEYQESTGWYEDAFIRVYKADLPTGMHPNADLFTHPWIVLKPSYSNNVVVLELFESNHDRGNDCTPFDPRDETAMYDQSCGHINLSFLLGRISIDDLAEPYYGQTKTYALGELRGDDAVNQVVNYIMDKTPEYPCRHKYNYLTHNSNTYVRTMLENSGFIKLYKEMKDKNFVMGNSSWGQSFWKDCSIEPLESINMETDAGI